MSVVQLSLGWGDFPSICLSAEILPSISVRFEAISADSLLLAMNSVGRMSAGTNGARSQKWYFATKSQYGRTESGIMAMAFPPALA